MKYRWTTCPNCHCEVAINYTESPAGVLGSLRRWNHNRTINDGKPLRIAGVEAGSETGFSVDCLCGQRLDVAGPDAVSAEREAGLRVKLRE